MSRNRTTVRLEPDTASKCSRSVARNASCRSGGTREVSPTTSPGSRALASAGSPSVAVRSPARRLPATRCAASGPPLTPGGVPPGGRTSATARSPPRAGASRATTATRVEGCSRAQSGCPARTRTGVSTRVRDPSGPVTRVTTASSISSGGPCPPPTVRGSEATVSSRDTRACSRASDSTGPARASARWSPATPAAAAAHSRAAAAAVAGRHGDRGLRRQLYQHQQSRAGHAQPHPGSGPAAWLPSARAAATQAAMAERHEPQVRWPALRARPPRPRAVHGRTSLRRSAKRRSPMPFTWRRSSTDRKPPRAVRKSTMCCASTGPTPGRPSS